MVSRIQSILFAKYKWKRPKAEQWVVSHGYHQIKHTHTTGRYHRIRLEEPDKFKQFRIEDVGHGIKFVIGFK